MPRSEHTLIAGLSDGGKTTEARKMHNEVNGVSVWCNHKASGGSFTDRVAGYRAEGREAMQTAVGTYNSWSDVRINLKIPDIEECTRTAMDFATDVFDTTYAHGDPVPTQLIIDEAHHLPADTFNELLAEARDKYIKSVLISQSPQKLPDQDLESVRYWVWVGEYAVRGKGWMNYYEWPIEEMPNERFKVATFDRQMNQLFSGETDETYA